jgi:hypothetical protein
MGAAMEPHRDFVLGDGDVGGHVYEVAEYLARRPGRVAAKNSGSSRRRNAWHSTRNAPAE